MRDARYVSVRYAFLAAAALVLCLFFFPATHSRFFFLFGCFSLFAVCVYEDAFKICVLRFILNAEKGKNATSLCAMFGKADCLEQRAEVLLPGAQVRSAKRGKANWSSRTVGHKECTVFRYSLFIFN